MAEARPLGVTVSRRATRREQAVAFGPQVGAARLAAGADAFVFGPGDGAEEACALYVGRADQVRTALRAGVSRWVRLRSDADPRPLFAHPEHVGEPRPRWWTRRRVPGIRRGAGTPTPA